MTVDTSHAIKMKPEPLSDSEDDAAAAAANELSTKAMHSTDKYEYADNYRRRLINNNVADRYKSLILGMVAALVVFIIVLAMYCATRRDDDTKSLDIHPTKIQQSSTLLNEIITIQS